MQIELIQVMNAKFAQRGPLTNLISYGHERWGFGEGDDDNFEVFSCGENDGENDGENTVEILWEITVKILLSTVMMVKSRI